MRILKVITSEGLILIVGDLIQVKYYNIVNDEEDKENPVIQNIVIEKFEANEDGSVIKIISDKGESFYDDNIICKL